MSFPNRLGTHAAYLGQMLRCCGVDPLWLSQDQPAGGFIGLARTCMACTETAACGLWLDAAAPDGSHTPPAFCPNAGRLAEARGGYLTQPST